MASKLDNIRKSQAEKMKEYGRKFADGTLSKTAAMKYFAAQVSEKMIELPAIESDDYSKEILKAAKEFHGWFYAGCLESDKTLPVLADSSLETYARQYVLIASPKVFANMSAIESAVNAFTLGKSKKDMHGKDNAAIFKQIASAVRKGKMDPAKITPELIESAIKPAATTAATPAVEVVLPADVLAKNAFESGIKAMLKDGGLDEAQQKAIKAIAKKFSIAI